MYIFTGKNGLYNTLKKVRKCVCFSSVSYDVTFDSMNMDVGKSLDIHHLLLKCHKNKCKKPPFLSVIRT